MPPETRHVFVYGTLCSGEQRDINNLNPRPRYIGEGSVPGTLYDLGSYPGIVLGGQGTVRGEVYRISAELETKLDEIEEVWPQQTGEYAKREVLVRLQRNGGGDSDGRTASCLVYEVAGAQTRGKVLIESGDWVKYRKLRTLTAD
ncbi:MAG: gamma-glutamylcyclotransferase [Polaromonas sp.]|uniref:gamma-glutamylcyclotransferase family protein n=1 Tax=Polaromonas sp. TaxID=1869339 RepID=UPI0025EBC131|nr:gamma-glutamylcyclotransferase family protein [Polaromonas sp.]MBI2727083.1 gamma-glutamylcyclotransferase [Polaromonas sp.]